MGEIKIVWSSLAEESFERVFNYLLEQWSYAVADNFRSLLNDRIKLLVRNPEIGESSVKKQGLKKLLITKHNMLFYIRIGNDVIFIVDIIDTRSSRYTNFQ